MDDAKKWLRIGLILIVAWIVLRLVFKVAGFIFNLAVIAGVIFVIYSVIRYFMGGHRQKY